MFFAVRQSYRPVTNDGDGLKRPLKKRNGVTAGVAPPSEPEPNHVGGGRHDDNNVSFSDMQSA